MHDAFYFIWVDDFILQFAIVFHLALIDKIDLDTRQLYYFGFKEQQKAYKLNWIGYIHEVPFIQTMLYLPESIFNELHIENIQPLYFVDYFKKHLNTQVLDATSHFNILACTPDLSYSLKIDKSEACHVLTTQYQIKDTCIALTDTIIPAKFLRLKFEIGDRP